MRRITTRIFFLAGVLLQGVNTVRADHSGQIGVSSISANSSSSVTSELAKNSIPPRDFSTAIDIKGSRPKAKKSRLSPARTQLKKNLLDLKAPDSLALPTEPSQVQIQTLQPISLADVEQLVEVNSPTLKGTKLQVEQAKSLLLASISNWYPTVNLTANGLPEYFAIEQFRNSDFGSDTKGNLWRANVGIQLKWNLINPARVPEIAASRDAYEKAKNAYFVTLRELRLQALTRYFLLQRADEGVRIGKESMRASLLSLRDAKARFEAGVGTRLEVLEAETQLARDKQLLTSKLGDQSINRRLLAGLLALPPNVTPTAASVPQVIGLWKASLQESIASAMNFREELDQVLLDISIANSNANAALAASQPLISLVNTFGAATFRGQQGVNSSNSVDMDDYGSSLTNTIGLNATWNIFDGGKAKALYRYNKQKAKEAEETFAAQRNAIRQEVEESFYTLRTANQDIATTTREVIASREALRLARLRFQAGVTTQREVVNNQRDLTQAEVRYSDAITTYNTSLAQLRRRTGIDHVKACKPRELSSKKKELDKITDFPIEPFPLIPACEASTITGKE